MAFVSDIRGFETTLISRMTSSARSLSAAYEARRMYVKTVRELQELDDRTLADLGLSRGEIQVAAYQAVYEN